MLRMRWWDVCIEPAEYAVALEQEGGHSLSWALTCAWVNYKLGTDSPSPALQRAPWQCMQSWSAVVRLHRTHTREGSMTSWIEYARRSIAEDRAECETAIESLLQQT